MWPALRNLLDGTIVPNDPGTSAWTLWWMKECILHAHVPWYTRAMFAPNGLYLSFHALAPLLGTLWLPVTLLLGPAQAVNALSIALPMIAAYAAHRLARALAFDRRVAMAIGAFYGFAPITLGRAAWHVMLAAGMALMPMALLAAIRLRAHGRARDAVALGAALGAAVLIDVSMAPQVIALVGLYWLGVVARARRLPAPGALRTGAIAIAVFLVAAVPQAYFTMRAAGTGGYAANPTLLAMNYRVFGTDVLAMIRPGPHIHLPAAMTGALDSVFAAALDVPATAGMAVFVLGAIGLVACWQRPLTRWAGAVWLLAFVLALGPRIAIGEHPIDPNLYQTIGFTPFPMMVRGQPLSALLPFSWLVQIPGLADFRVAQRFAMLATLPAALLAGSGLAWLLATRTIGSRAIAVVLGVFAILEMAAPPMDDALVPVSRKAVYRPIRADHSQSVVVDVPFGWVASLRNVGVKGYRTEPVLRATEHGHPIASGFTNRLSDWRFGELAEHPFYAGLIRLQYDDPTGLQPWPTDHPPRDPGIEAARADRQAIGIRWAVVHPDASRRVIPYLKATGFRWSHAADGIVVFRAR